jgi:DsbC/DsbD-like thiol-disulfide interchange protein
MKKSIGLLSALLGFICLCSSAMADPGSDRVQVTAIADTSAIVPGKPFMVGLTYTIEPGFHIYWKNPGDSGLATEVKLKLPEGFTASELMFPVPSRLQLAGDILNYAYEDKVMLMVQITPPKDLPVGKSITLAGKTTWLVCKDDCVPGQAKISLELLVADSATPANADLFKQWTSQLPVKKDAEDISSWSHSTSLSNGTAGIVTMDIGWKKTPSDVQFIPGALKNGDITNIKVAAAGDSSKISFNLANYTNDEPITGLLVFTSAAGVKTGVEISIPYGAGGPASDPF